MVGGEGDPAPMCEQERADPITDCGSMGGGEITPHPAPHTHINARDRWKSWLWGHKSGRVVPALHHLQHSGEGHRSQGQHNSAGPDGLGAGESTLTEGMKAELAPLFIHGSKS